MQTRHTMSRCSFDVLRLGTTHDMMYAQTTCLDVDCLLPTCVAYSRCCFTVVSHTSIVALYLLRWREQLAKLAQKHAQKPGVNNPPSRAHAAVPSPDASRQTTPVSSSAKRARSPDSCRANGDASASQLTPSQADDVVDALASLKSEYHANACL
jgi:hypothetical protein